MVVNSLYVATNALDYAFIASVYCVCYAMCSESLTPWKVVGLVAYTQFVANIHEHVCIYLFSEQLAKVKIDSYKKNILNRKREHICNILETQVPTLALLYFISAFGFFNCHFDGDSIISTILSASGDFWVMDQLNDSASNCFIHPWMHKKENYKMMHKRHHQGNRNLNLFHSYVFDLHDLFLEFFPGILLTLLAKKLLFGVASVHILAVARHTWSAIMLHSVNPLSVCSWNPLFEFFFKTNVAHNLHHSLPNDHDYMSSTAYHHLDSQKRKRDTERYNNIMKTDISFGLFH